MTVEKIETAESKLVAKLGGLYVTDVWTTINKVNLGPSKEFAQCEFTDEELQWLQNNVYGIKFVKIKVTIEEVESPYEELIF